MIYERRKVSPLTTEDSDIVHALRYRRQPGGRSIGILSCMAQAIDASIMQRLARTPQANMRSRAYADQPGELLS